LVNLLQKGLAKNSDFDATRTLLRGVSQSLFSIPKKLSMPFHRIGTNRCFWYQYTLCTSKV
jgi:hypothetical protein